MPPVSDPFQADGAAWKRSAAVCSGGATQPDGDSGQDIILGLGGNDPLDGGSGNDTLIGGPGVDTFVFGGVGGAPVPDTGIGAGNRDIITDFQEGRDHIDLSHLSFGAPATWSSEVEDGNTIVRITTAVSSVGEIELAGVHHLTANDFTL